MIDEAKLNRTLTYIGDLLVQRAYSKLESLSRGVRLTGMEMEAAVSSYGRTLVPPPQGFESRSVVPIKEVDPERWSVYVDLWTEEEGRSDLTLELTVIDSDEDVYEVEIDDIHVL